MEANDNREGLTFEDRKTWLVAMAASLEPGADGRAGRGAIIRELEQMQPGLIEQAFARQTAHRLGLEKRTHIDIERIDWSGVDYADA